MTHDRTISADSHGALDGPSGGTNPLMAVARRTISMDPHFDGDVPTTGTNPLVVITRRWPLLLVGLVIGMLAGVLIHMTGTPAYQSGAQLLVLKKRTDIVGQGGDVRVGVVEDYVATQLTLIKSERIRMSAAKELQNLPVKNPLPEDPYAVAGLIQAGLKVERDKDTANASGIGSGVVLLSFRGPDPTDTKLYLDAVIKAYSGELTGVYDTATQDRIAVLEKALDANLREKQLAGVALFKYQEELSGITTEDVSNVRARVSSQKDKLNQLQLSNIEVNSQLELIQQAGNNRRDRIAVMATLTGQSKFGTVGEQTGFENSLKLLEVQRKALSERLGKDHPQMKELETQIEFYKAEIARLNPDDPSGQLDELAAIAKQRAQLQKTNELQIKNLEARLFSDEKTLISAGGIKSKMDVLTAQITQYESEINRLNSDKRSTQVSTGAGGYSASAITPPSIGAKVAPVLFQSLLMGLVIGLGLGGLGMLIAELNDKSFKSPGEIRRRLGLAVIGHIPRIRLELPGGSDAPGEFQPALVAAVRPRSMEAEAYRGIRTQLLFSTQGLGHQVIQVTSPNPGDGKSTLAANLAITIAQAGKRVVLVDCDFRKPQVHKLFGLTTNDVGVATIIAGNAPMAKALRRSPIPNLDLMPCGPRPESPAELFMTLRFHQLLTELRNAYDYVIIDTPPILAVSDPAAIASQVDGIMLVIKLTKNSRPSAERTREQLVAIGANIIGVVVNGGNTSAQGYEGYNYGSGGGYKYADYEYATDYHDDPAPK